MLSFREESSLCAHSQNFLLVISCMPCYLHVKLGPLNFRLRLSDLLADLTINLYRCISIQITNLLYFLLSSDCRMYPGVILCWVHQLDGSPRFVCDSLVTADRLMRQIRQCQFFPLWSKKSSSWPLSRAAIDYFPQQKNSWYLRRHRLLLA